MNIEEKRKIAFRIWNWGAQPLPAGWGKFCIVGQKALVSGYGDYNRSKRIGEK